MAKKHLSATVSLTSINLQNIINQLLFIFWQYSVLMRIKKLLFKTLYEHKQKYSELWHRGRKWSKIQRWEAGIHFTVVWKDLDCSLLLPTSQQEQCRKGRKEGAWHEPKEMNSKLRKRAMCVFYTLQHIRCSL